MLFLNPLALLALLSIPIILGLHFFRERRRVRRIGGLHLWEFARVNQPAGRRFDRLIRSLPLLFQILAALLLSLLLAGLDWPERLEARHFTVVLDDSISMQARTEGASAAERVTKKLLGWAGPGDRFTLVTAGTRPALAAGPFANHDELNAALKAWQPESPICDFASAVNLAAKFSGPTGKIVFATDNNDPETSNIETITFLATGRAVPNAAVAFADRLRLDKNRDRILVTVRNYSPQKQNITVSAAIGGQIAASNTIPAEPNQNASFDFEISNIDQPVRLEIGPQDALMVDNSVVLAPVKVKTVRVYVDPVDNFLPFFRRAIEAVPNAYYTDAPKNADLAFVTTPKRETTALRTYLFPSPGSTTTASLQVVQGNNLILDSRNRLTRNLATEGVLWAYAPATTVTARSLAYAAITGTSQPLLYTEAESAKGRRLVMNLHLDATNIFRTTAWPVLMQNMVEECRENMPGMSRTNFRTGEEIPLRLEVSADVPAEFFLFRDGHDKPMAQYSAELPPVLGNLPTGGYKIIQGAGEKARVLAAFQVNLFAPGESDLQDIVPLDADLAKVRAETVAQSGRNRLLFYSLLAAALGSILMAWYFQERGL